MTTLKTILTLFTLTILIAAQAQDGSDIQYVKVDELDSTHIGQRCHLDFYNRSFGGHTIDTVAIDIDGHTLNFVEHRQDDGYNNWFREQYLESIDQVEGLTIRIHESVIDSLTTDKILVTSTIKYYDQKDNDAFPHIQGVTVQNWFSRDIVTEVLIKN